MKTITVKIDPFNPHKDIEKIKYAGKVMCDGGLVAFPTETVYGLGANAFDSKAAMKIYEAKGRPADNPLIAHIANTEMLTQIANDISPMAEKLIKCFWPGPLTLIFNKTGIVPNEISSGLSTIAVRYPKNKIAQLLIEESRSPIAAPSANVSGRPSPTKASHVEFDMNGKIDMILDGGRCEYGLESTIVSVVDKIPILLRPGSITVEMLNTALQGTKMQIDSALYSMSYKESNGSKPLAPGMKYKHYSPKANVTIVKGKIEAVQREINRLAEAALTRHKKPGIMTVCQSVNAYKNNNVVTLVVGNLEKPETIAANLFSILRKFDYLGVTDVYAEGFDETDVGFAIMNRLKKAAGYQIINVEERS